MKLPVNNKNTLRRARRKGNMKRKAMTPRKLNKKAFNLGN